MDEAPLWQRFARDPRWPANAELRAGHADRELVLEALTAAYADGRLDAEEFEQRADDAQTARTLGELPPLLSDLVPEGALAPRAGAALVAPEVVQRRALEKWQEDRRDAVMAFVAPTVICWTIWAAVMFGGFPWPLFVMIPTGLNLIATLVRKQEIIASEVRRIERRAQKEQARALKREAAHRELEGTQPHDPDAAGEAG